MIYKRTLPHFLLYIFYCLLFSSCGNNSSTTSPEAVVAAEKKSPGQSLYESNCTNCHGSDGRLCALGAKDLSVSALNKEQVEEMIANGKNTMTAFGNILNPEQIGDIAEYTATLKK